MAALVGILEAGDEVIGTGRISTYYPASSALTCMGGVRSEKRATIIRVILISRMTTFIRVQDLVSHSCASAHKVCGCIQQGDTAKN
jgi:hypothetical protein